MDLSLICGLIETESTWDVKATSNVGAKGLMQLMPSTARPYLANHQLGYSDKILYDPLVNVTVGMAYLFDLHQQYMELGVEKENEYMFSVNSYFWGQNNVAVLLGKKDARVNGPNFAYAKRVLDAAKFYKEKGI
jgi:soluble lytic murein transglycosylase